MNNDRLLTWLLIFTCSLGATANAATEESPFHFQLRSHEGREWSSDEFQDKKLVVIAFLGTECPLVRLYGPRLQRLSEEYADEVAVIGVNANTQDSMTEIAAYAERYGVKFPLLKDVGNKVADQFKAKRTPEVFLLDAERKIRYHGRIDDQYAVGISRDKAQREDLREAIDELLAGQQVSVQETEVVGCHIGRIKKAPPTGDITYTNQIARIFNKRCVECHRDGELAPFTLTSYDDIVGWEDTICEVIEDNRMPPWFASPDHGKFRNDCRLSSEEKETVFQWVDNGMPKGDPADLPEPPEFTPGWKIDKPDEIFHMRERPFKVRSQGTIDYQYFVVDPKWTEDKYICQAEARPDNKSVVHHILVYIIKPGQPVRGKDRPILVGYAPGSMPVVLDPGVALKVEAGSKLLFQLHYTPNGYAEEDRSYIGVKFMEKERVKQFIEGRLAMQNRLRIPPNSDDYSTTATYRSPRDEMLIAMTPHMHLRGKAFRYEAFYPDGKNEVLLDVPRYDFNWQLKYILEEPKLLPKGTAIKCTAVYDNSESNLANPNPEEWVRWGDQSWEEMMIGFFDVLPVKGHDSAPKKSNANIDPTGTYSWKGAIPGTLRLELRDNVVSGTLESGDKKFRLDDAHMDGDQLRFTCDAGPVFLEFNATVQEKLLRGKIAWTYSSIGKGGKAPWSAYKD